MDEMDASELAWLAQIGQPGESAGTRTESISTPRRHNALRYENFSCFSSELQSCRWQRPCSAADDTALVATYAQHTHVLGSSVLRPAVISGPFQRHPGHKRGSVLVEGQDLGLLEGVRIQFTRGPMSFTELQVQDMHALAALLG